MSAGSLPKLTKTEPWELIQAFAEAQNQAAAQANQIHAQQAMEAMREAGADRRMERAHALGIDKLKQELAIKSPYEIAAEQRQQQNALGLIGAKGEEGRKDITLQGEVNTQTHRSNKQFDVDADVDYRRRTQEIDEPYKERADQRTLDRQKELDSYRTDQNIRQQKELEPLQVERERRQDQRTQTAEERQAELQYKYRQRGATEDQARRLAEQDAQLGRQKEMTRFSTDEAIRREKETEDTRIARERAKQEAMGGRQLSAIDRRTQGALDVQARRDQAALERTNLTNEAKQEQIRLREQLRQVAPRFAVPPGLILHDPEKFIEEDRLKLSDPNQYEKLGIYQNPLKPGKNFEVYRPKNPSAIVPPTTSATPNAGGNAPPASAPARAPNADTGVPTGQLPNTPPRGGGELDRPPASTTPAPPATQGPTPTPPPDTDWLRRSPETERPPSSTGTKGGRLGEVEYPEGARAQYASLGGDDDLSQFRDRPGVTDAPKDSYRSIDRAQQPVTTSGRPENRGTFLKTADEASGPLRDKLVRYATKHGLNPDVLAAVTWQESKWKPDAVSHAGATGIAQFMPGTARRFGINPYNVDQSLDASAKYIQQNRKLFNGNLGLALAGYNWGEGNVQKFLRGERRGFPTETRNYVQAITGRPIDFWVDRYRGGSGGRMQDTGRLQEDSGGPQYREVAPERYSAPAPRQQQEDIPLPPRRPSSSTPYAARSTAEGAPDYAGNDPAAGVHPDLAAVIRKAQEYTEVPFNIHEGLRDQERQADMVRRGWSKTMNSEHLGGAAVDLRAQGDQPIGKLDRLKYARINQAIQRASQELGIPVVWGGSWKGFPDIAHFQLPKGYVQERRSQERSTPQQDIRSRVRRTDHPDLFYVDV